MPPTEPAADAMLTLLERERAHFLAQVARVPGPLRSEHLVSGAWSVVEVVEHVARVDRRVARILEVVRPGDPGAGDPAAAIAAPLAASVVARIRDRTVRLDAPERVRPTGTLSPGAALEALAEARAAVIAAYHACTPDVLDGAACPHPYFGPLTLRAWVELSAHHDARHAGQLAELAAAAGSHAAGEPP